MWAGWVVYSEDIKVFGHGWGSGGCMRYVGGPPDILDEMWPWGILGVCHQGSVSISRCLSWIESCASPGVKWQRRFLLLQSMLVHTGYSMYRAVSLPNSFPAHSYYCNIPPASLPPRLQPLNQGHSPLFPETTAKGNREKTFNKKLLLSDFCTNTEKSNTNGTEGKF